MKLNLLPTTVSAGQKSKYAWLGSLVIAALGIGGMVFLTTSSQNDLRNARTREAEARPRAAQAVAIAAQADEVIAQAQGIIRNTALAQAMIRHNDTYPALYDQVLPYMPPFYRVTAISAVPTGPETARVTITGVLDTYQQYADLMIGLLRIQGVTSVSRSGYIDRASFVPPLTPEDQTGRVRPFGSQTPIPDNEFDRLAYLRSTATTPQYDPTGGFGDPTSTFRGAGPNSSLVTVTLDLPGRLQVPDIETTLRSGGGAAPAAGGAGLAGGAAPVGAVPGGAAPGGAAANTGAAPRPGAGAGAAQGLDD